MNYDKELEENRDKKQYRNKGKRQTLNAARAPKKDGKGNRYVDNMNRHMPLLDAMQTASRKRFKRAFS